MIDLEALQDMLSAAEQALIAADAGDQLRVWDLLEHARAAAARVYPYGSSGEQLLAGLLQIVSDATAELSAAA